MNGDEVRTARERLGWSRQQLADRLGLTIAKVARIETRGPTTDEEEHLGPILERAGIVAEVESLTATTLTPPPPPPSSPESSSELRFELPDPPVSEGAPDDPEAQVVLTEWRGVKRGQVVKIDGEVGKRFTFGYYFRNPSQEFISVYSTKNGGERSFRPERLRTVNGKVPVG